VHLIIAEKNISAKRIAQILAGNEKVKTTKDGSVFTYSFDNRTVVGLKGHVVEVDFEPGYANWRSTTHTPRSLIDAGMVKKPTEKKIVNLIQKLAKKADLVTIATDYDTEGELIGKEAYELVRAVNPDVRINRARFSAITPAEIRAAFENPVELDFNLAAAGEARQTVDLMWGAALTRFLSLAARRGGRDILSVGRVQSPTLAMIVDREREIENFVPQTYWVISAECMGAKKRFTAKFVGFGGEKTAIGSQEAAQTALERITKGSYSVKSAKWAERRKNPAPPFTTSNLQQEAARKLNFTTSKTMLIAQQLYEGVEIQGEGAVGLRISARTPSASRPRRRRRRARSSSGGTAKSMCPRSPTSTRGARARRTRTRPYAPRAWKTSRPSSRNTFRASSTGSTSSSTNAFSRAR